LTRTLAKFFPVAVRERTFVARLRREPLKPIVSDFVLKNKGSRQKPGALAELVQLLARVAGIPLDAPTQAMDPSGAGVRGVDPVLGAIDLLLTPPAGRAPAAYADASAPEALARAFSAAGLDAETLARYESSAQASLPVSGRLWLSVPEHKLYALSLALQHRGFMVRLSLPDYPASRGEASGPGFVLNLGEGETRPSLPESQDLALVKVRASAGVSEARVMAALELLAARVAKKGPSVISLALSAPTGRRTPLSSLVDKMVLSGVGVVVGSGNEGPALGSVSSPGDSKLAVVVAAASREKGLQFYSSRGARESARLTWTDLVDHLEPGRALASAAETAARSLLGRSELRRVSGPQAHGTAAAAEATAAKLASLAREMRDAFATRGRALPAGWFEFLVSVVSSTLTPMPAHGGHEVGGGLYDDEGKAREALALRLRDLGAVRRESEALAARSRALFAPEMPEGVPQGRLSRIWEAVKSSLPGRASYQTAEFLTHQALEDSAPADRPAGREELKLLKRVLGDGTSTADGPVRPFGFKTPGGWRTARSPGLEGFIYTKRELAREGISVLGQLDDQFAYLEALFQSVPWAEGLRAEFSRVRRSSSSPAEKERRLDALLTSAVEVLRSRMISQDPSAWGRRNATYMIFSRAYNRLKPGKNFFKSLDREEMDRIKTETRASEIWLMDVFEIGEIDRWGTGGGSSYSIKGYRVKPELGGDAGLKDFVARAHAAGLKVKLDFIPNHFSLDSDMIKAVPEGFIHILPPQDLSDDQILASMPGRERPYRLVRVDSYPFPDGARRPARVLVHHPRTDWGDGMWTDLAQIDYTRAEARAWMANQLGRLFSEFGVDSVRRDMAYDVIAARFFPRWKSILERELSRLPAGWLRDEHAKLLSGFVERAQRLEGREFLEEATDAVKTAKPDAVMIDEAYAHAGELSRSGSDGLYNKADFDASLGQVGLYDAMTSRDAGRIRAALQNAFFRRWQRGGAAMVNFIGTHDGGEGNPVDKFGRFFKAAVLTALMLRPILMYNGFEQGVGQKDNLIGELSKSVDTEKAIPYDIPVLINWAKADPDRQAFLSTVLGAGDDGQELFDRGAMEVLSPTGGTPIVAWSAASREGGKAYLLAANWSEGRSSGVFKFDAPILKGFGAFEPKAGRRYLLRDLANPGPDGRPRQYRWSGKDLIEKGLYLELDGAGTHLFEVLEAAD